MKLSTFETLKILIYKVARMKYFIQSVVSYDFRNFIVQRKRMTLRGQFLSNFDNDTFAEEMLPMQWFTVDIHARTFHARQMKLDFYLSRSSLFYTAFSFQSAFHAIEVLPEYSIGQR